MNGDFTKQPPFIGTTPFGKGEVLSYSIIVIPPYQRGCLRSRWGLLRTIPKGVPAKQVGVVAYNTKVGGREADGGCCVR